MIGTATARDYQTLRTELLPKVLQSFELLAAGADLVLVEGAGSPAEVNLRANDIANMGSAEAADVPVVLVGDIERGGVLAQICGTHLLLSPAERQRLKGVIVNKFRGDVSLFAGGIEAIRRVTALGCLGVVPWFERAQELPAEDALALERMAGACPRRPVPDRGAALAADREFRRSRPAARRVRRRRRPGPAGPSLAALRSHPAAGLEGDARRSRGAPSRGLGHRHPRSCPAAAARVLGLCAGYQMLGRGIADPAGRSRAPPGEAQGLGLLEVDTVLTPEKTLQHVTGVELGAAMPPSPAMRCDVVGGTAGPGAARPMLRLGSRLDGAVSADGRIMGCHVHGIFASDGFRRGFLERLGGTADVALFYEARVESALEALADHCEAHLDVARLLEIARAR